MQNIKYHIVNLAAVLIFSYTSAYSINAIVRHVISPVSNFEIKAPRSNRYATQRTSFNDYKVIFDKGFFPIADQTGRDGNLSSPPSSIENLTLIGTITGPPSIARAMIKKRGEKQPGIFATYKSKYSDTTNEVYGYKLVRIYETKVYLTINGEKRILELFNRDKGKNAKGNFSGSKTGNYVKKNLSRSYVQQKVLNNINNATRGLLAGPYRRKGRVVGFQLKKVRPYNILYKIGLRSGDVIFRINGKTTDNPSKMLMMWNALKTENRIRVNLERRGKPMTYDLNITQ